MTRIINDNLTLKLLINTKQTIQGQNRGQNVLDDMTLANE